VNQNNPDDVLRQLAAIETPARGLRILSNFRILVVDII
jgi:hypothetical protein